MVMKKLLELKEFGAAGLYEEPNRSLFYRKALGLRRFYENCDLPAYHGEVLYPVGKMFLPDYLNGLAVNWESLDAEDKPLADQVRKDFLYYQSPDHQWHSVRGKQGHTHSIPYYERILKEGFLSYIPRIQKIEDAELKEGLLHLLEGIHEYVRRCVAYLETAGAEEQLISALKQVPMKPARNIHEAVVAWNFILYLDSCDNLGCVASGLLPYYNGEDITKLLACMFDNLDAHEGFSMALGTDYNPLTIQVLEAVKGKRRPLTELFVDENTPDEIWDKAFEVLRTGTGQPAFYNPSVLLGGLQKRFKNITDEDIKRFCGCGCTESMIAGLSHVGSLDSEFNLALILENSIYADLEESDSFETFYNRYIRAVSEKLSCETEIINDIRQMRAKHNPLPMRTLLVDDCIDRGLDFSNGGARYNWSIISFSGIINVIDSMLAIRDCVFVNKTYTKKDFLRKLAANDMEFITQMKNHSVHFGDDNSDANDFSQRLTTDIFSMLDDKKFFMGEGFLPASIQYTTQVDHGKKVGTTPDGRAAGAPLCDSIGAIFGKDVKGPTALLNSVTSLNLERALGVPVLNFNLNPDFKDNILKALILGYMKRGGIQMQITSISREMLEEAYRNPEDHKNIVVRVGGYSEYFCRLSDEMKRMIIARTIQNEV